MTIAAIEAIPFRLRPKHTIRFANGSVGETIHVLIRIRTDDGLVGVGEASPRSMTYGDSWPGVVHTVTELVAPQWLGKDERRIEARHDELRELRGNHTARAALDTALHDLVAQRAGVPVATLLGGFAERVRASHLLSLAEPAAMAAEAGELSATMGIRSFKVKTGLAPTSDVERVVAVSEAVGEGGLVYIDANHGWRAHEALEVMRALEKRGVKPAWLEEPNPADDVVGRRWLAERIDVPVVGDESTIDLVTAATQLRDGLCHWVALKAPRTGFRVARQIVGLARGMGAEVVVGSQIEGALGALANLHLAAAWPETSRMPAEVTSGHAFATDLIDPLPVNDGWMQVPDAPGLGVTIDEARLDELRVQ